MKKNSNSTFSLFLISNVTRENEKLQNLDSSLNFRSIYVQDLFQKWRHWKFADLKIIKLLAN